MPLEGSNPAMQPVANSLVDAVCADPARTNSMAVLVFGLMRVLANSSAYAGLMVSGQRADAPVPNFGPRLPTLLHQALIDNLMSGNLRHLQHHLQHPARAVAFAPPVQQGRHALHVARPAALRLIRGDVGTDGCADGGQLASLAGPFKVRRGSGGASQPRRAAPGLARLPPT